MVRIQQESEELTMYYTMPLNNNWDGVQPIKLSDKQVRDLSEQFPFLGSVVISDISAVRPAPMQARK